jgi:hypothetical protein
MIAILYYYNTENKLDNNLSFDFNITRILVKNRVILEYTIILIYQQRLADYM